MFIYWYRIVLTNCVRVRWIKMILRWYFYWMFYKCRCKNLFIRGAQGVAMKSMVWWWEIDSEYRNNYFKMFCVIIRKRKKKTRIVQSCKKYFRGVYWLSCSVVAAQKVTMKKKMFNKGRQKNLLLLLSIDKQSYCYCFQHAILFSVVLRLNFSFIPFQIFLFVIAKLIFSCWVAQFLLPNKLQRCSNLK